MEAKRAISLFVSGKITEQELREALASKENKD